MIGLFGEDLRAHCMLYLVEAHVDVLAHEQRHSVILGCTLRDLRRLGAKQLENEVSRFHQSCASSCDGVSYVLPAGIRVWTCMWVT